MKTFKITDSQIMSILKQAESGTPVAALCREHGMSNANFFKWHGYIFDGRAERVGNSKY